MKQTIFITTPTGNIGSKIVGELVGRGETVHVLARNPDKLPRTIRDSVTVHVGDLLDESFVVKATEGVTALFWLTPPMWAAPDVRAVYQQSAHTVQVAVNANKIPYVVNLSSTGADKDGYGPISLVRVVEDALNATDANVVHLRPGFFFENFAAQIDPIKNAGAIFMPMPPESRMPMVATADIARIAAELLAARNFAGKTYRGVHGPADLSFTEVASAIGAAIGKEVRYVQTTSDQARETFLQMGASPDFAGLYVEMFAALSRPTPSNAEPRTPETTTPTTLSDWAEKTLKPAITR
ncbi:MAG: NmrA family NAD(P)-binding protein [Fibrella sp.]|nr:NmrA family NAD(P)-binding protein [Armatimonadota bacterium]